MILAVGFLTGDIGDVKGSMTEAMPNVDGVGYDVYVNAPLDVSTYKTARPILKVYSASIEHEFNSVQSSCSYSNVQFLTPDGTVIGSRGSIYKYTNNPIAKVSLDAALLTDYYRGRDIIDIYAVMPSTCSKDATPTSVRMTMELNDMDINYDPIECSTSDDCNDDRIDTIDTCFEYMCNHAPVTSTTVEERTEDVMVDTDDSDVTYLDYIDDYITQPIEDMTGTEDTPMGTMDVILFRIKLWLMQNIGINLGL